MEKIKFLLIEDVDDDAVLILRALRKGGFDPIHERVESDFGLEAALVAGGWDLVLSDFNLPQFSGTEALALVRRYCPDLPVIMVSGVIGEETAASLIRDGAYDYVLKDHLDRLCQVVRRALADAHDRRLRLQVEESLTESRQRYQDLVETCHDLIWQCDAEGRFVYLNPAWEGVVGYSVAEMLGRKFTDFDSPAQVERDTREFARIMAGGETKGYETVYIDKDGREINLVFNARNLRDREGLISGTRGTAFDITAHRRASEALRQSEERFRRLFTEMLSGFALHEVILNDSGEPVDYRFLLVNQAFERQTGLTAAAIIGKTVLEVMPRTEKIWIERYGQVALSGEPDQFESYSGVLGRHFEVRAFCPQPGQFAVIFNDITERKLAEEEHLAMERRLLHSQKLESLGIMAGGIAHDFNNLLMAILGNLDLALMDLPTYSKAWTGVSNALIASRRAADLTQQILAYSGKANFEPREVDLSALVTENAHLFRAAIARTTSITLRTGTGLPHIKADPGQIQQIIMNLITNAAEAIGDRPVAPATLQPSGRSGEIIITTGAGEVEADLLGRSRLEQIPPPGYFVWVEVRDNGCGMDEATQQRLFDPFFTTKFLGRGLGLSAVLGIVKAHAGAILVDSAPSSGTVITVFFSAAPESTDRMEAVSRVPGKAQERPIDRMEEVSLTPEKAQERPVVAVPAAGTRGGEAPALLGQGYTPKTILVADDEDIVLAISREMIELLGYPVLTASDGEEAVRVFREHRDAIGLVILDFAMPAMDGMAACRALRAIDPEAKIILSTGYHADQISSDFAVTELAGFIQKPYSLRSLREIIEKVIAGGGAGNGIVTCDHEDTGEE